MFTMAHLSSIKSAFLYNPKVHNFIIFFGTSFNIQKANDNLFNKYVVYKINQYIAMNIENYSL